MAGASSLSWLRLAAGSASSSLAPWLPPLVPLLALALRVLPAAGSRSGSWLLLASLAIAVGAPAAPAHSLWRFLRMVGEGKAIG